MFFVKYGWCVAQTGDTQTFMWSRLKQNFSAFRRGVNRHIILSLNPRETVCRDTPFRIRGKFENQCTLAAKRIEERLAMAQKLDVHGYVMVQRNVVGRLIGKGGTNVKMLQRRAPRPRAALWP